MARSKHVSSAFVWSREAHGLDGEALLVTKDLELSEHHGAIDYSLAYSLIYSEKCSSFKALAFHSSSSLAILGVLRPDSCTVAYRRADEPMPTAPLQGILSEAEELESDWKDGKLSNFWAFLLDFPWISITNLIKR